LGDPPYFCLMFIRKKRNKSGSVSVQILTKVGRKNKLLMTVGCANTLREEELLVMLANTELQRLKGTLTLFTEPEDLVVENFVNTIANDHLQVVGAELILGKIYQKIGFPESGCPNYFKNLVLCRLVYPGSKLKTVDYFKQHLNTDVSVYSVYRFLDDLSSGLKPTIEQITFEYTKKVLSGKIGVVFYDMTTLYFESSEEDDYRIPGFNKDGKHQQPQIMIGLLVAEYGYPIGYEIFEGNTSETKTLIPILESFQQKFEIGKPIIVADAALLSQKNINALLSNKYEFILGGRIKNEAHELKAKIAALEIKQNHPVELKTKNGRLIVSYSEKRAHNDQKNRQKGLRRLEKKVKSGKLTKEHINNRGYNKYLMIKGEANISIDYEKYQSDAKWDGLKGFITNTKLTRDKVIENYSQLWQVEKAFRISKTDLRIRPVYHRLKNRIEAHICICFAAYIIYKELERLLRLNQIGLSVEKAIKEIKEIRQLKYVLPKSKQLIFKLLRPNENQNKLLNLKI